MSDLNLKLALINQLLTVVSEDDCAFENKNFDASNKALWYSVFIIPATEESTGKQFNADQTKRGLIQISVNIPLDLSTYESTLYSGIELVRSAFRFNQQLDYNGQLITISESSVNNGIESGAWYKRDISINYLTTEKG